MIKIKRAYEKWTKDDGFRILVDRLWPRGVSKEDVHLDLWLKDIAPSTELRQWFGHDPKKWDEFEKKYKEELMKNIEVVNQLKQLGQKHKTITLLFGARDTEHNEAKVLAEYLRICFTKSI